MKLLRRVVRVLAILAMLAVFAIAALVAFLWLEHRTAVALPTPTGSFAVGRVIDLQDARTPVWIWYPAVAGPSTVTEDYLPAHVRMTIERVRGPLISNFLTRDLARVRAHSLRNAAVSPRERSYPVVIMIAGPNYSTLAEDLASHGYVVAGFDPPRDAAETNPELCVSLSGDARTRCVDRVLTAWNASIASVIDRMERLNISDPSVRFRRRLDMTQLGVFGHSFGGATAAQFCHDDSRCKAGVNVDGAPQGSVIQEGIGRPFMFLLSDHSRESDPESRRIKASIQSIYDRLPADGRLRVAIRGANHFTFSDDGALLKSRVLRGILFLFGRLRINGRRQLVVTVYCLHTFFDAHLKGTGGAHMKIPSPLYPEIQRLQ